MIFRPQYSTRGSIISAHRSVGIASKSQERRHLLVAAKHESGYAVCVAHRRVSRRFFWNCTTASSVFKTGRRVAGGRGAGEVPTTALSFQTTQPKENDHRRTRPRSKYTAAAGGRCRTSFSLFPRSSSSSEDGRHADEARGEQQMQQQGFTCPGRARRGEEPRGDGGRRRSEDGGD